MPLYRALSHLSGVAQRGQLTRLAHLTPEQVATLERAGAVARVASPPLAELPGWKVRAAKLAKVGIHDIEQMIEADSALIAACLRVKPATAARYQEDVRQYLVIHKES